MEVTKQKIIESLHKVICSATSTVSDMRVENNDYFKRRVLGFRAEIEFVKFVEKYDKIQYFEGGKFISKKLNGESSNKNKFIYVTLATNSENDFGEIYSIISNWDEVDDLIYIKTDNTKWTEESFLTKETQSDGSKKDVESQILIPKYTFYRFDKTSKKFSLCEVQDFSCILAQFEKPTRKLSIFPLRKREQFEYFAEYEIDVLKNIYANRYFLDVVLRQASGRQVIDLDGFLKTRSGYCVVEIKEKSPIINEETDDNRWQFGWDSRRILWYLYLRGKLNLPILYNVREINNREERKFIKWDSIFVDDFLKGVSWSNSRGGGGGEDTLLAPYSFFKPLSDILDSLS